MDTTTQVPREHPKDILVTASEILNSDHGTHILRAQKLILEKILQSHDLSSTLNTLCLQFEKIISPALCAVLLTDDQTSLLHVEFSPNATDSLRTALEELTALDYGESSPPAVRSKKMMIIPVVDGDPRINKIRQDTHKYGIQSYWSIPIIAARSRPVGAFAVLHQQHQQPSTCDLYALETAAHLAGLALKRHEEEREIHANKERLQNLFDSAPVAYFSSSMDGKILSANTCAAELTGLSKDTLIGRSVLDLYSPTLHGRKKAERINTWIKHGLEINGEELELERPDGGRRWVSLTVRLIRDSMGTPIERRGILEDISHRKQAEHLLAEQKTILEMIAKGQPLHHTLSRLCQGIETASPEMKCSIHRLEGTTLQYLTAPSLPETYITKIASIQVGPTAGSCGTAVYRREPVVVSDIASDPLWNKNRELALRHGIHACWSIPIFSSDNEILGTMAMYYPSPRTPSREDWEMIESSTKLAGIALEQDRDRVALKQSEARYRILYEDNPSMYFTIALDGTIRSVNHFGASQLGFTTDELLGTSIFSICYQDDLTQVQDAIRSYLQTPSDLESLEFRQVKKDGTVIWVRVSIRLVVGAEQESVLLLVSEDVTTQKQMKETLISSEQALQSIVEATGSVSSGDFFHTLTRALAQCLGVKYAYITEWADSKKEKLQTLSFWHGDRITDNFAYSLHSTPCQFVMEGQVCFYAQNVQHRFPNDQDLRHLEVESYLGIPLYNSRGETIGHLVAMDHQPLPTDTDSIPVLKIFAARAAAELERKYAEDALRRSEERLRQVIDLVPHFIFAKDKMGRFILANQAVADVYGTSVQNLIGKTDKDFTSSPQEVDHFRQQDLEVLETGKAKTIEERITDAQGQIRHLYTIKIPFVFANSTLPAILGVAIDITDRKQGEDALRLTQHVFDILPDHVAVVGPDYRYRRVNKVYEEVHGLPATDILGKHISDLLGKRAFLQDIKPNFDRCLAGEIVSFERWFHFRDGQDRYMAVTYSPLQAKGKPQHIEAVVVNARDLTHRKHMEEVLTESEEHLRILLDERIRISQDLHDHVLQSIYAVGLIIAAIRKPLDTKNFSEVHAFLDQAVRQVNGSIMDIRGFIEGLPQADLDVKDFKTELRKLVQSMTIPDGPVFKMHISQEAVDVLPSQDAVHLLNITRESMSNSLRHANATKGSISFTKQKDRLQFAIRDNGMGFRYQEGAHSGHGLINMKARAKQLHGTLAIRSVLTQGTRIIIHIPITTSNKGKSPSHD